MKTILLFGTLFVFLTGCGSANTPAGCMPDGFHMLVRSADPTAAPDHTLAPPGNQEQFVAGVGSQTGPGCALTNSYADAYAQWSTSDPKDVAISSAQDNTNGLATCLGTTASGATVSATLTAYGFTQTYPAPITCK